MQATFYVYFNKPVNSTKLPAADADKKAIEIDLLAACSILEPVIRLHTDNNYCPQAYNYCYIKEFDRYYFIEDWTWEMSFWTARLSEDVLASYRSHIGSKTCYVLRASNESDSSIADGMYPATAETVVETRSHPDIWGAELTYVVGVIGAVKDGDSGTIGYYSLTADQFIEFRNQLLNNVDWWTKDTLFSLEDPIAKAIVNPVQYIASIKAFPVSPPGATLSGAFIPLGQWNLRCGHSTFRPTTPGIYKVTLDVPKHPQASARGKYLNREPFSQYYLIAQPWGSIPIPSEYLYDKTKITLEIYVDFVTGDATLLPLENIIDYATPLQRTVRLGVDIPTYQMTKDVGRLLGAGDNFGAASRTRSTTGAVSGIFHGVVDMLDYHYGDVSGGGPQGGFLGIYDWPITLMGTFSKIVPDNPSQHGRPLCARRKISTLGGYIETDGADFTTYAYPEEYSRIQTYMKGGFYYE